MAGRELKLNDKVRASTILEVVISMIVILVVFGMGMTIFGNVTRMSLSGKKLKAQAILKTRLLAIEQSNSDTSRTSSEDDFRIGQEIKPYGDSKLLLQVHLTAYDSNNETITELQKVIIKP